MKLKNLHPLDRFARKKADHVALIALSPLLFGLAISLLLVSLNQHPLRLIPMFFGIWVMDSLFIVYTSSLTKCIAKKTYYFRFEFISIASMALAVLCLSIEHVLWFTLFFSIYLISEVLRSLIITKVWVTSENRSVKLLDYLIIFWLIKQPLLGIWALATRASFSLK